MTDKPSNGYTRVYYEIMKDYVDLPVNFFEIGIYFGASIKMWNEFFPKGKIFGIDNGRLLPQSGLKLGMSNEFMSDDDIKLLGPNAKIEYERGFAWLENENVKCKVCDQRSWKQLQECFSYWNCNNFDFVLDDGQHFQEHQQRSLALMFPLIKSGGYYIIEDVIPYFSLSMGQYWGQKKKDCFDSTDYVFTEYLKGNGLKSPWISESECEYISKNIDDIFLYDYSNNENSPINGTSKLLVIKKL
jgi:hypothetical protein